MSQARAKAALHAMMTIGIPPKKAKPVLKHLLEVYENRWEYIEAENYRVLADAIFDMQEEARGKKTVRYDYSREEVDEVEPLRKRARQRQDTDSPSPSWSSPDSAGETSLERPRQEAHVPSAHKRNELVSPPRSHRNNIVFFKQEATQNAIPQPPSGNTATVTMLPRSGHSSGRVQQTSPHMNCKEKSTLNPTDEACQSLSQKRKDKQPARVKVHNTQPLEKHNIDKRSFNLVRPKDEPCDYHSLALETPIAMMDPPHAVPSGKIGQSSDHGSSKNYSTLQKSINTRMMHDGRRKDDKDCLSSDAGRKKNASDILSKDSAYKKKGKSKVLSIQESSCGVDIASSNLGEVKLMFNYSSNRPDFHFPDLEAVFKQVEDRCLKSYKILQPGFSIVNLMKEMCQCFWELGSETTNDSARKFVADNATSYDQVVVHPQHALGEQRPFHYVDDISKGEEKFKISVVNEITNAKIPPSFNYIPRNIVYQNAYVNFSLARIGDENCCPDCLENCLAAPIPCACAQETGGEFAYTSEGLIRQKFLDEYISLSREPHKHQLFYCKECPLERSKNEVLPEACKGHLVRKFIKECWSKCGCSMHCGNRVVQRGIVHSLQVFLTSERKGWGLRTLEKLPRGAFVCEYVGEVLTNTELYDRIIRTTGNARHTYPVLLDADWGSEGTLKDEEALCLDATFYGNVARFINHRCYDANLIGIPVEIESPDHHYYHLSFFTRRAIDACEELTWDYGIDFDDHSHPVKAFRCRCGSSFCRDINRQRNGPRAGSR